jgi:hypothetical protein
MEWACAGDRSSLGFLDAGLDDRAVVDNVCFQLIHRAGLQEIGWLVRKIYISMLGEEEGLEREQIFHLLAEFLMFRRNLIGFGIWTVAFFLKCHPKFGLRCPQSDDKFLEEGIVRASHGACREEDRFQIRAPPRGQESAEELAPANTLLRCKEMLNNWDVLLIRRLGKV